MAQSWLSFSSMAGYDPESERQWDEYQWERFLQQQDEKTEAMTNTQ